MQTGGTPILGYNLVDGKLVINKDEAETVRAIFSRFIELESTTKLAQELRDNGVTSKVWTTAKGKQRKGKLVNKSHLYRMLNNPKYLGKVSHKGKLYDGEHPALIEQATWDAVHAILERNTRTRATETRFTTPAMLKGIIRCGHCGCSMKPAWSNKNGKVYRYYVCIQLDKQPKECCQIRRISAAKAEDAVMSQLRVILSQPEIIAHTARTEHMKNERITERDIREILNNLDAVWECLFPVEQTRIIHLLLESVSIAPNGIDVRVKHNGLTGLLTELTGNKEKENRLVS